MLGSWLAGAILTVVAITGRRRIGLGTAVTGVALIVAGVTVAAHSRRLSASSVPATFSRRCSCRGRTCVIRCRSRILR